MATPNWQPDTRSHVVLTACQECEFAREVEEDTRLHIIWGFHERSRSSLSVRAVEEGINVFLYRPSL